LSNKPVIENAAFSLILTLKRRRAFFQQKGANQLSNLSVVWKRQSPMLLSISADCATLIVQFVLPGPLFVRVLIAL
jgi:hypothetical protein